MALTKRRKVLMARIMPYTTLLNRARMFRKLGWEPSLVYEQPPANSPLFIEIGRVFENAWSLQTLLSDARSAHEFIRKHEFDLLYTVGPPDRFNVNFTGAPCAWIHDMRDMTALCDPQAEDQNRLHELRENFREMTLDSSGCVLGSDLTVYVSPWQKERGDKFHWDGKDPKPSVWLPNVPYFDVSGDIRPNADKDPDVLHWGYTGTVGAAWHNAGQFFGHVASELDRLGVAHKFHLWSFMEMQSGQDTEWMLGHDTREQHEMIKELGGLLDYAIIAPPTDSDGMNAPTGWPGKLGDYIMAGVPLFLPANFFARDLIRKNGWGFAYDSPQDVARIMAARRQPKLPRQKPPALSQKRFLDTLDLITRYALKAAQQRIVRPAEVVVAKPVTSLVVASDGNRYHAENHISKVLGAPYTPLIAPTVNLKDYDNLYILGMWAADAETLSVYEEAIHRARRVVLQWAGSDIMVVKAHPAQEYVRKVLTDPKIRHYAPHINLAHEVSETLGVPCPVIGTPSRYVYDKPFRLPRRFAVSVYYPNLDTKVFTPESVRETRSLYGLDLVDGAIRRLSDVIFYLHYGGTAEKPTHLPANAHWLGAIPPETYPEFLKTVSCFVRMTTHDGMPYSVIEHACAGRYVISTQPFPMVTQIRADVEELCKAIKGAMLKREPDEAAAMFWRGWNDFERFRNRIRGLLEDEDDAQGVAQEAGEAVQEEGVVG